MKTISRKSMVILLFKCFLVTALSISVTHVLLFDRWLHLFGLVSTMHLPADVILHSLIVQDREPYVSSSMRMILRHVCPYLHEIISTL